MPQPHILKISEIFSSIAGEGLRSGEPTIFLRLAGCNLRCAFCDTKFSWQGGREYSEEKIMEIVERIHGRFPTDWVCLTGGEPLLQDVGSIVKKLKRAGLKSAVISGFAFMKSILGRTKLFKLQRLKRRFLQDHPA